MDSSPFAFKGTDSKTVRIRLLIKQKDARINDPSDISFGLSTDTFWRPLVLMLTCLKKEYSMVTLYLHVCIRLHILFLSVLRDRLLTQWLPLLVECPIIARMFEETALLRDNVAVGFLIRVLQSLHDFRITLETSLTKGVEL